MNISAKPSEAYVDVHDEPMHRFRMQNSYAYLYDVLIPAGAGTLYHRHAEDTLYVSIKGGDVRSTELGKEPLLATGVAGRCLCQHHRSRPLIHKVENLGTGDARLIGVEVRSSPSTVADSPLEAPGHSLQWEAERLRAYDVVVAPGETVTAQYGFTGLLVFLEDCRISLEPGVVSSFSPADWIWHDAPISRTIANVGTAPMRAVLAEWR